MFSNIPKYSQIFQIIIPIKLVVQLKFYVVADPPTSESSSTPLTTSDRSPPNFYICYATWSNFSQANKNV